MEQTTAILLRKYKLTESSLIVHWLTEDVGRIKTVAKGALGHRGKFSGTLDLFFECEVAFKRSSKSDLHTLCEVSLIDSHPGLRREYRRVQCGAYFVELLELATESEHPMPEHFDLLKRALGFLDANPASRRALLHFEKELVRLLGIESPDLSAAVALGRVFHRLPTTRQELLDQLA